MHDPQRILVIKLRAIGDVVMATPVVENLRRAFPGATIDFLTEKACAPVVTGHPAIHQVIEFDRARLNHLAPLNKFFTTLSFLNELRGRRYDLIFDLFGNPRTAIMTLWSGAKTRVGYRFRGRRYAYNVVVTPRGHLVHEVDFNLDALRALKIPVISRQLVLPVDRASDEDAESFWIENSLEGKIVIGLNPSGGWYTKRWPLEHFAALGDRIAEQLSARVVLIWGPGELEDARHIAQAMRHEALLIPKAGLMQLAALLRRLTVLVSNDSGPLHIAAAAGTPVVGIYGPTRPELQGPWGDGHRIVRREGLDCLGCNGVTCRIKTHDCMKRLEVDIVFQALYACLDKLPKQVV